MRIVCLLTRIQPVAAADSAGVSARRRTALHIAVIAEDQKSVNALLAMGAALEARDGAAGETALHLAAVQGCAEIVYALLNAGADPLCPDASGGWMPLHAAARVRNKQPTPPSLCAKGQGSLLAAVVVRRTSRRSWRC